MSGWNDIRKCHQVASCNMAGNHKCVESSVLYGEKKVNISEKLYKFRKTFIWGFKFIQDQQKYPNFLLKISSQKWIFFSKTHPYDQQTLCPRNHGLSWVSGPHLGGGGKLCSAPDTVAAPSECRHTLLFPKGVTRLLWCLFLKQTSQIQIAPFPIKYFCS